MRVKKLGCPLCGAKPEGKWSDCHGSFNIECSRGWVKRGNAMVSSQHDCKVWAKTEAAAWRIWNCRAKYVVKKVSSYKTRKPSLKRTAVR